jgi:predicted site-specific integrase-resolvase
MDILKAREEVKFRSIKDLTLRVAYYARVSTEKDEQLNSLKNQQLYYENYIGSNKNWTLVNGYIDEVFRAFLSRKERIFIECLKML